MCRAHRGSGKSTWHGCINLPRQHRQRQPATAAEETEAEALIRVVQETEHHLRHRTICLAKSLSVRVFQRRPGMASPATDCRRPRIGQEGTGSLPPILWRVRPRRFGRGSLRSRPRRTRAGGGRRCRSHRPSFPRCTNRRAETRGPRSIGQVHRGSVITSSGVARLVRPRTEAVLVRARHAQEVVSIFV
jgi:hypothetical protein